MQLEGFRGITDHTHRLSLESSGGRDIDPGVHGALEHMRRNQVECVTLVADASCAEEYDRVLVVVEQDFVVIVECECGVDAVGNF